VGKHYIDPVGQFSKKIARLLGQLGSGVVPIRGVSASFQNNACRDRGPVRARTPPRGRQGRCSAGQQGQSADRADEVFTHALTGTLSCVVYMCFVLNNTLSFP